MAMQYITIARNPKGDYPTSNLLRLTITTFSLSFRVAPLVLSTNYPKFVRSTLISQLKLVRHQNDKITSNSSIRYVEHNFIT